MLYIGSTAHKLRTPKDVDIIATSSEFNLFKELYSSEISQLKLHKVHYSFRLYNKWYEIEICDFGSSGYDYQNLMKSIGIVNLKEIPVATKEIMLSIKKSHVNFPVNFYKNIIDYNALLSECVVDIYPEITKKRFKETEDRLGILKTPRLNKSSKMFFEQSHDFFKTYFIHDHIHEVMSHNDRPLYEYMQVDKKSANCSKNLWDKFSDDWKDKCVLEEAYVIALERKLIPSIFGGGKYYSPEDAIKWSLMRICTNLCSGWFRQWACDNWIRINSKINKDYLDKFLNAVDDGRIKLSKDGINYTM